MWDPYILSIDGTQASREMGKFFKICRDVQPTSLGPRALPFYAFHMQEHVSLSAHDTIMIQTLCQGCTTF